MTARIPLLSAELTAIGTPDTRGLSPTIGKARSVLARAVYSSGPVDQIALELVRMRNARLQQCNL